MLRKNHSVKYLAFLTVALVLLTLGYAAQTQAASLTQAMLRLNRLAPNTALSGLVCAQPSSAAAGSEGRVRVTFPSDFSLSASASDWTTGTSSLPSGTSAWPGISSTAQSVSGTTVTFASNDLTSGSTNYCFTFNAASSTTGSSGQKTGSLTTTTSGGTTIDTREYGLTITNDQIGVSATVPANPTDFTATLTQLTSGSTFPQGKTITYELEYGSRLAYPSSLTVEAGWSQGTIAGSGIPSVDVLSYVIGSASDAYNSAPPVIDLANRKITWTISNFPANTTRSVTFSLQTTDTYTADSLVSFTVSGRLLGPGTATGYSTKSANYQFKPGATPTPTPGPTNTPGPGEAATPTPVGAVPGPVSPFTFLDVFLRTISSGSARIEATLSRPGSITVAYGRSQGALSERLTSLNRTQLHTLTFTGLMADTTYYLRMTATDDTGKRITSDLFAFTTASLSTPPKILPDTFIATGERNILFSPLYKAKTGGKNFLILPPAAIFETQFAFDNASQVKTVFLLIRQKQVLGINTFIKEAKAQTQSTPMLEIKPGVYTGRLQAYDEPGYYELYTRVSDYSGNLTEEKIAELKISKGFRVLREDNHEPVEAARVFISLFNPRTRLYEALSAQALPIQNPVYSDYNGTVPLVLPPGRYRAELSGLGFSRKTVDFTLGIQPGEDYPRVFLQKQPFSLLYEAQYLLLAASDLGNSLSLYVADWGESRRFFRLTGFLITLSFLLLTLLALSRRTHVRLSHLPRYFLSLVRISRANEEEESFYRGMITNGHTKEPLAGVDVFVSDVATGKTVFHTKSNASGRFRLVLPTKYVYLVLLEKIGYHPATLHLHHVKKNEEQQFALLETTEAFTVPELTRRILQSMLGLSFEILLLLSVATTMLMSFTIGFFPVLPFLTLSVFNLVFWGLHEIHVRQ